MYTLFAYGGDLTAGRRKAAYVYGDWSVSLPDGVDTEPQDNRVGRGYVARVNGKPRGRFDHTFVQEGASVDMQSKTTDLEVVLDDAFTQTDGEVFFEHDITGVGLNGTMPERDYTTGDLVRVVRWGKAMVLPVTGTALKTDQDGRIAGSTHVGGELISSKRATQKLSDELRRSISKEMADTVRTGTKALRTDVGTLRSDVTRVSGVASSAQTAADNAQSTADSAKTTASSAYTRAGTAITRAGNAETVAGEARRKADSALQTVDLATGNMGQYLDQVSEMVDDARAEVTKAEAARTGAESALSSAEQINSNMSQWATDIGKEVSKAEGLVSDVSQASADLDPKIRNVTDLLSKATAANTDAIRLNTEADQLRDRAIIDLTDAGKKLATSQQNLQAATSLNTSSISNLEKSQREHAAATRELGTAQQALAQAVQNNSKVASETRRIADTNDHAVRQLQLAQEIVSSSSKFNNATSRWLRDMFRIQAIANPKTGIVTSDFPRFHDNVYQWYQNGVPMTSASATFTFVSDRVLQVRNLVEFPLDVYLIGIANNGTRSRVVRGHFKIQPNSQFDITSEVRVNESMTYMFSFMHSTKAPMPPDSNDFIGPLEAALG